MSKKWHIFLNKSNPIEFKKLLKLYWAADFVNLFFLGALGSESYKAVSHKNKKDAFLSSMIDRVFSFLWYLEAGFIAFLLYYFDFDFLFLIPLILIFVFISIQLFYLFENFFGKFSFLKQAFVSKKELFKHSIFALLYLFLVAFTYQISFLAVGIEINYFFLLLLVPVVIILTVLPISFSGLGIREFLFIQFGMLFAISIEQAVLASFILHFVGLIYRALGTIPFMQIKSN